jgi:hypothetical protein
VFFSSAVFVVRPWFASAFGDTRPAKTDGSYVGDDASARIDPSFGSSATIAPPRAAHCPFACASEMPYWSAFSAACWSFRSSVRRSVWPGFANAVVITEPCGRPSESWCRRWVPATPRR